MKLKRKIGLALVIGLPMIYITACSDNDADDMKNENVVTDTTTVVKPKENKSYYQIPSPDEMFGFIKESGLAYNGEFLISPNKVDAYSDPNQQTQVFGIYSADLAYTAAFGEFNQSIKYFGNIQKLSDQIGISGAFDKELIKKIQSNLNNTDSLVKNASDSYFSVVDYLEENEQGDKLGVIASAGWLETVYIVVNTTNFKKNKAAVDRIADQKLTLENLLAYLDKYKDKSNIQSLITQFSDLQAVFNNLGENEGSAGISFKKKKDGKMVLGGGSTITVTEEQFNAIKNKVNEIRNNMIKTNA